ncbi:MAG: sulfite exporter TauE/SafE family protein [Bacteroidales bacterium]
MIFEFLVVFTNSAFKSVYLWLPLFGLIIGLFGSMAGSGGGFFFPLILMVVFDVPPHIAVPTALAATLPVCLAGSVSHYHKKNIHFRLAFVFAAAGILGAMGGAVITSFLSDRQLSIAFSFYALILALVIFFKKPKKKLEHTQDVLPKQKLTVRKISLGAVFGFAGGMISGTFGTNGAGPVLAGLMVLKQPVKIAIGTSLFIVLINTSSAFTGHYLLGEVDFTLLGMLTAGSVAGAVAGPWVLKGFKPGKWEKQFRHAIAFIILFMSFNLFFEN